ncbi:hypothetical protein G5714_013834 [Onychostoma macrolepis]|uniref:Uncharacterized protein n=1 Tax=Onychostoma macrolepis TaxID=369639 RepID=A0A7J6CKA9_9TELE|nr:hypothetical protein G5714_013834 [Onychostoma macrolepis]
MDGSDITEDPLIFKETLDETPSQDEQYCALPLRRSSWLAGKTHLSINEWPKDKILSTLYSFNIQAPPDLSHEQLFHFLIECSQESDLFSPASVALPHATGRKATSKRKHLSSDNPLPLEKSKRPHTNQISTQQRDYQILSALTSIQGVLSKMDERIQTLEDRSCASTSHPTFPGVQSSGSSLLGNRFSHQAEIADMSLSRRTLRSAVPAAPTGVPFFPPAAAVSPQLCVQILAATFTTEKGDAMTKQWFSSWLRIVCRLCGLNPAVYTNHSFRIGAVTTAASKVAVTILKAMGRWSSSAYQHYVRPDVKDIFLAQKAMSST